ncbi:unnamed protein product [Chrysoparadoxa australica]
MLMGIAGQLGGLEPLLQTFFSFLHRRTDLYVAWDIAEGRAAAAAGQKGPSMGFPKGQAEKIVLQSFRSFPYKKHESTPAAGKPKAEPTQAETKAKTKAKTKSKPETKAAQPTSTKPLPPPPCFNGKQIPTGNGGIDQGYYWTQTLYELTVYVELPEPTKANMLHCDVGGKKLVVGLTGQEPIINGDLMGAVVREGCLWTLESGCTIVISLEKGEKTWWKSVVVGGAEIDTTKVDSTCNITEYDEETQGAIRKVPDSKYEQFGVLGLDLPAGKNCFPIDDDCFAGVYPMATLSSR